MSAAAITSNPDPIFGTSGNDLISVDKTVSFTWIPDAGNSFVGSELVFDPDTFTYSPLVEAGPSSASGTVTFNMPSSQPADGAAASNLNFRFTKYGDVGSYILDMGPNVWIWNPATGVLDPGGSGAGFYDTAAFFTVNQANYASYHGTENYSAQDSGHWAIVPNPINVDVFGGAGDDTIYGGQGHEVLSGDAGNDVIYAGYGEDVVFGGKGNDALHGGVGTQFLDGGNGNDTIWGGTGTQVIMGDAGADLIWGGNGPETMTGGAGNDTLWGGSGDQYLDGGAGVDVLHAGTGNDTLLGGAGHDTFVFGNGASGQDVIADFHIGQDTLQITPGLNGLTISRPQDLATHIGAGTGGNAMIELGAVSVTLLGVSAHQLSSHLQQVFKVA